MTKVRDPLSFEKALTTVAGVLGWPRCAQITGTPESTLRNWSDPDVSGGVTFDKGEALDLAYIDAGGAGVPFLACYAARVHIDAAEVLLCLDRIARAAAKSARESGEAHAAVFLATRQDAGEADFLIAERELEESIAAQSNTLATLRAGRRGEVQMVTAVVTAAAPQPGGAG